MSRSRSFRRAQLDKAKKRARRLWTRVWRVKSRILPPGARWRTPGPISDPTERWVGHMASTHCRPCSCIGCKSGTPCKAAEDIEDNLTSLEDCGYGEL